MIFRSKRSRGRGTDVSDGSADPGTWEDDRPIERLFDEIDALGRTNRAGRNPEIERRVLRLRHLAGLRLIDKPVDASAQSPSPAPDRLPSNANLPEVAPGELTPEVLRAAILRSGSLLVRGLVDTDEAARLADEIDRAYEAREARASGRPADGEYYTEFEPDPRFDLTNPRRFAGIGAGLWAADSPKVMLEVLDMFERTGLQRLATGYLGERPAISVHKCLLRKVTPDEFRDRAEGKGSSSGWHQDGQFLGDVRALNVWVSLSRCGDEAPGLDIVPRRIERIVPTGTDGASLDWTVSPTVVEEAAGDAGIVRPIFGRGDVLLFDEFFLHSTAVEPGMRNARYAVECWFFRPSAFPSGYAPLAP
jgi:hypothetical protein